ncbi:hypothetical protein CXB51_018876 [Gossypium anomalum]|uniref:Uncharacterized protein n=1 Tax=Gossypium anomalum TaxID=47600 RepID=A0A8J5Y9L6_9ROSI|nr:hypothetical protein CXB51_018876 [Gossypium anomalum]
MHILHFGSLFQCIQKGLSFVSSFQRMASIFRAFQTILIILILMPFLHSSSRITTKTTMAEETSTATQELQRNKQLNRLGGGGPVLIVEEKREVPTGPDPLHHNCEPTTP